MSTPTLADVVAVLDRAYDPATAEDWDAVGTTVGDPTAPVAKILLAVDPVRATVEEAIGWGADLLLTHHPLLLRGVTSVAASTPKGRVVHALLRHGIALHTCHTNADTPVSARPCSSDSSHDPKSKVMVSTSTRRTRSRTAGLRLTSFSV